MAMTGGTSKLVASGTPSGWPGPVNVYVYYKTTQDKTNNKSTITCGMYVTTPSGWDIGPWNTASGAKSYVGTTSLTFDGYIPNFAGTRWLAENKQFTVNHNSDGTGSATIYWKWDVSSTWAGIVSPSGSFKITLPSIPRSSAITSASNITLGNKCKIIWTPASTSFKYKIKFSLGNWNYTTGYISPNTTSAYTYGDYTISGTVTANNTTIYKELPKSTSGTMTATLTTYNSSDTKIGSSSSKTFTVTIPDTVKPSLGTISLDPVDLTSVYGTSMNYLVQGKNKLTMKTTGAAAGTGSTIKSYKFEVLSGTTVISTTNTTSASVSLGPFTKTGILKFRLTVTDNRGRSVSNSGNEPTCTCYAYGPPSFSSFTACRCKSDGTADNNGEYIKYSLTVNYSAISNSNNSTVKIYYKKSTASSWTSALNALTSSTTKSASAIIKDGNEAAVKFDINSTYYVYATVTDNYKASVDSSKITIFGSPRIFNIRSNGSGIAFGKMAEKDNLLESKWPVKFDSSCAIEGNCSINGSCSTSGGLTVGTSSRTSTPTKGITIHDVRDVSITPDSFGDKNANFYFDQIDSRWMSVLHMKGWTGDYAAWELAGNAHSSSNDNTLKYRQGIGETWGDWQTVLTNKNINNYVGSYLPLSGGNLTGKIALPHDQYYKEGNAGIDCNNSDIVEINGLYFKDASDSSGESINFYRSDGYWDTLYAYDGVLRFHPNRGTNTSQSGYRIYDTSYLNFRRGTCTLSSSTDTTVTFSSALGGNPTVMLTPLTTSAGVIPGKVKSVSKDGFTAIIGGSAVSSAKFAYLAIYY